MNAPWGVTQAPKGFFQDPEDDESGKSGKGYKKGHYNDTSLILVGNFGDGKINAYTTAGQFVGQLRSRGKLIIIDGL